MTIAFMFANVSAKSPGKAIIKTREASHDVLVVWREGIPEAQPARETICQLKAEGMAEYEICLLMLLCQLRAPSPVGLTAG